MANELLYGAEAAAEYDRGYSHVSAHFLPFLLRAARLATGHRVLDVATGTGIAAEAVLGVVGSAGSVVATDISREMVEKARERMLRGQTQPFPGKTGRRSLSQSSASTQ
jgi:ubiquinone/menaquinone biosynthesis C-methylase UbiE